MSFSPQICQIFGRFILSVILFVFVNVNAAHSRSNEQIIRYSDIINGHNELILRMTSKGTSLRSIGVSSPMFLCSSNEKYYCFGTSKEDIIFAIVKNESKLNKVWLVGNTKFELVDNRIVSIIGRKYNVYVVNSYNSFINNGNVGYQFLFSYKYGLLIIASVAEVEKLSGGGRLYQHKQVLVATDVGFGAVEKLSDQLKQ